MSETAKFNAGKNPVINGGKKLVAEGKAKAKGASRVPIGKRK